MLGTYPAEMVPGKGLLPASWFTLSLCVFADRLANSVSLYTVLNTVLVIWLFNALRRNVDFQVHRGQLYPTRKKCELGELSSVSL